MKRLNRFIIPALLVLIISSCTKNENPVTEAKINFVFRFDSTQQRLNNIGQPATIPAGNAAQSPVFNKMSAHYLELAQNDFTPLGGGEILYKAAQTTTGGATAIDFDQAHFAANGETFLSVPLKSMAPGSYKWLRVSLAYQNYDIKFRSNGLDLTGTLASFIGFNTYLRNYKIKDSTVIVNSNKAQGYWAFETSYLGYGFVSSGDAAVTTVPNPINSTSPIPPGSCVVTGSFASPLVITGNETGDITIVVSLSTNKSFEWRDNDGNGIFDIGTPSNDVVVDMGIRGLIPIRQ